MSNDIREKVQQDALDAVLKHKRATAAVSMGVGKTLIGLKYIEHFQDNTDGELRVLVVAPKLSIFQTWVDESKKFNIKIPNIEFTTYISLNKHDCQKYDVVILDECHNLLKSHLPFLGCYTGRILGLTGTPPRYIKSEKGQMVNKFCPVVFNYITDEAVESNILNDYRIIVHRLKLSTSSTIAVKTKNKDFYTSELKNYQYWTSRIAESTTKKQEQIASIMRMKALMDFRTKEDYAKKLFSEIEDKCILFCNTQAQADKLCDYSYHSSNEDSEHNLDLFKKDKIDKLSCVLQLNEGVNIPNLRAGIIMHSYGNERKASQRINIPVLYKFL